jgi:Spy/CpxP family protein refolding chaperone
MQTRSLFRKSFVRVLGLSLILSSASLPAVAQDTTTNPEPSPTPGNSEPQGPAPSKMQHVNPEKMKQRRLAHLEKIAQLTPDQESKVTPIISNFVDQSVAVRNNSSLQPEEKKAKQKELRRQFGHQLKAVLTPQQIQALRNSSKGKQQRQEKGQNQNSNTGEEFEQGSNQPGSDI